MNRSKSSRKNSGEKNNQTKPKAENEHGEFVKTEFMEDNEVQDLQIQLRHLCVLTQQGSYNRRLPGKKAISCIEEFIVRLHAVIAQGHYHPEVLLFMSQAKEMVLDYQSALDYFLRYLESVDKNKSNKDKKRIARLQSEMLFWKKIVLTPSEFKSLCRYLEENYSSNGFNSTKEWLASNGFTEKIIESIIDFLQTQGIGTDLMLLEHLYDP